MTGARPWRRSLGAASGSFNYAVPAFDEGLADVVCSRRRTLSNDVNLSQRGGERRAGMSEKGRYVDPVRCARTRR